MSTGPSAERSDRLISIDFLRGIAVLAVIVRHLPFSLRAGAADETAVSAFSDWVLAISHYGEYGVHLFLVISGFCIHLRWARRADVTQHVDFLPFWKRRLMRLYPPYIGALLISLAALFVGYAVLGGQRGWYSMFGYTDPFVFVTDMIVLLLLFQNVNNASQRVANGPFWSLALEEQLYMLYFPLLWLRRKKGWGVALAVAFVSSLVWRISGYAIWDRPPLAWWIVGPAHWFEWTLGALAVEAYFGHVRLPKYCYSLWSIALFAALCFATDLPLTIDYELPFAAVPRDLFFGAMFFVIINRCVQAEREGRFATGRFGRAMEQVGAWSYSVYLTHAPVMIAVKQVLLRFGAPIMAVLVLRLVISMVFGYLYHRIVELRFIELARRSAKRRAVQPGAITAPAA
jgi:peptidoglycan/LPS O-acetylase OafA/YrhL